MTLLNNLATQQVTLRSAQVQLVPLLLQVPGRVNAFTITPVKVVS